MADQAQFETDVKPHLPQLRARAVRLTRNHADAEDLLQDALFKAYRGYERFSGGTNLGAWLNTVLRTTWVNNWRHDQRRPQYQPLRPEAADPDFREDYDILDPLVMPAGDEAEERVMGELYRKLYSAALRELPDDWRDLVVLIDVEGMAYKQAAKALGIPVGTVMSRLHRARRKLQSLMLDHYRFSSEQEMVSRE